MKRILRHIGAIIGATIIGLISLVVTFAWLLVEAMTRAVITANDIAVVSRKMLFDCDEKMGEVERILRDD